MKKILFVYNADAGLANGLLDMAHKIFSPRTYACSLCGITYGLTSMRPQWKEFLQSLSVETHFLHRDEFQQQFPGHSKQALPAIFWENNSPELIPLLLAAELAPLSLPDLMNLLRRATQAA